jgi:hypothetical protein
MLENGGQNLIPPDYLGYSFLFFFSRGPIFGGLPIASVRFPLYPLLLSNA